MHTLVRRAAIAIAVAAATTAAAVPAFPEQAAAATIIVDSTIQSAVDNAAPGDTIVVPAGVYRENVVINTPGLTIEGRPGATLDGTGLPGSTGIRVRSANPGGRLAGFTLRGLHITHYSFTGVLLSGVDGFRLTGGTYTDNDEYGVFPVRSSAGRVDHNRVGGSADSGIYIGQSDHILIDHNTVHDNTVGIEVELATVVRVEHNTATGNAVGALVQIVPFLARTETRDVYVHANVLSGNRRPNPVTDPDELLARLPGGVGLAIVAADGVTVTANVVSGNPTAGVGAVALPADIASLDARLDTTPDRLVITGNVIHGNGSAPDPRLGTLSAADIVWDGTGESNCFTTAPGTTTFPTTLPICSGGPASAPAAG
jgi:parallel beta-helix repeat protein